jgi:hypothetical protein
MIAMPWRMLNKLFGALILCCVMLPLNAQQASPGTMRATDWSEAQIRTRIHELEAERDIRLGITQPNEAMAILSNPHTWIISLSVTAIISSACMLWIILIMWRQQGKWMPRHPAQQAMPVHSGRGHYSVSCKKAIDRDHGNNISPSTPTIASSGPAMTTIECTAIERTAIEYTAAALPQIEHHGNILRDARQTSPCEKDAGSRKISGNTSGMYLVQFWMELEKPDAAIAILEHMTDQERTPYGWLLLFDLYWKTCQRQKYEHLRQQFRRIFNGNIPAWNARANLHAQRRLTDLPEINRKINHCLTNHGTLAYLKSLIYDDRNGTRHGFDYGVFCDLVKLFDLVCTGKLVLSCEEFCR